MSSPKKRIFLREVASESYGLQEQRTRQLSLNRVRSDDLFDLSGAVAGYSGESKHSRTGWRLAPGDEEFLTQTIQVHFGELAPGGANKGHGHQNEALFYILEGAGYEVHDGKRYDWEKDDLVIVHTDSVHQHFNLSQTQPAKFAVFKAKSAWMYLGLLQQGSASPFTREGFGGRVPWSSVWTEGVEEKKKVLKPSDTPWLNLASGKKRILSSPEMSDVRVHSVDLFEERVDPGKSTSALWHMADEVFYVVSGEGTCLQWEVAEEIADRYYAHFADTPTSWRIKAGDLLWVPQNSVRQFVNSDGGGQLVLLSAQNRVFKMMGYNRDVAVPVKDGRLVPELIGAEPDGR